MYLDSRDLIEKREELKQQVLDDFNEKFEYSQKEEISEILFLIDDSDVVVFLECWEDELKEIEDIDNLESEVSSSEWDYGITFIPEDEFEEYCKELVKDCGFISRDTPMLIQNNIDWAGVAEDMKMDYSEVEFRGVSYLYRS